MQDSSNVRSFQLTDSLRHSNNYQLVIIQEPEEGRSAGKVEKTRGTKWPIDPPPVVEFTIQDNDKSRSWLHSPFWFCTAEIEPSSSVRSVSGPQSNLLTGCLVSSLHKVKLTDNREHGLFIFGDLNAKVAGHYRLRFTLYEMRQSNTGGLCAAKLTQVRSKDFKVLSPKEHQQGPHRESTSLSRILCEAGVKLRIRKESSKRKAQANEWAADKRHSIGYSAFLPPPPTTMGTMAPPSWGSTRFPPNSEDVSHRMTVEIPGVAGVHALADYEQRFAAGSSSYHLQGEQSTRSSLPLPNPSRPGFDTTVNRREQYNLQYHYPTERNVQRYDVVSHLGGGPSLNPLLETRNHPPLPRQSSSGSFEPTFPDPSRQYRATPYSNMRSPQNNSFEDRQSLVNGGNGWTSSGNTSREAPNGYTPHTNGGVDYRQSNYSTSSGSLYAHSPYGNGGETQFSGAGSDNANGYRTSSGVPGALGSTYST